MVGTAPFVGSTSILNVPWENDVSDDADPAWIRCWTRHSKSYVEIERYQKALEMKRIRNTISSSGSSYAAVGFNDEYLNLSRFLGIVPAGITSVVGAIVACAVIALFFIGSFFVTFLVTIMVCFIDTCLFGMMALAGINLNETSLVTVVMACGFAVDYCAHIGIFPHTHTKTSSAYTLAFDIIMGLVHSSLTKITPIDNRIRVQAIRLCTRLATAAASARSKLFLRPVQLF